MAAWHRPGPSGRIRRHEPALSVARITPLTPGLLGIPQLERVVDDLQGPGAVFLVDDAGDLDLAGGDVLDIDLGVGQGLEHALGDAGVDAHADADDAHLRQVALERRAGRRAQFLHDAVDDRL